MQGFVSNMSQRRMFSPDIVKSPEFLSMPVSSQLLYFHLGMEADDDGFVHPQQTMRSVGMSGDDNIKILIAKRFVLPFESGVVVIKHWLIHNMIRGDRYKPTRYQDEKKVLFIKDNKAYTDREPVGCQIGNQMAAQVRSGEDRILDAGKPATPVILSKDEPEQAPKSDRRTKDKEAVYLRFSSKWEPWWDFKQEKTAALQLFDRGLDKLDRGLRVLKENADNEFCPQVHTPYEYTKKLPKINAFIKRHNL